MLRRPGSDIRTARLSLPIRNLSAFWTPVVPYSLKTSPRIAMVADEKLIQYPAEFI
jgi:hypothetical protein